MTARTLTIVRTRFTEKSTIGRLYVDGRYECFTLEDLRRPDGEKEPGRTAIPAGTYRCQVTYSPRFKRPLPLVEGVQPGFEGIRIHAGNTAEDTEGCILVGSRVINPDFIGESLVALEALMQKLPQGAVWLTIIDMYFL